MPNKKIQTDAKNARLIFSVYARKEMKLNTLGLELNLRIVARTLDSTAAEPYDDWLKCEATVTVPSFTGIVR